METGESSDVVQEELEREPEATTEDELLKDHEGRESIADNFHCRVEDVEADEVNNEDTEEAEIISLRRKLKHSASLPSSAQAEPSVLGVGVSSNSLGMGDALSSQDSADSAGSSRQLLSASNSPQVPRISKSAVAPFPEVNKV